MRFVANGNHVLVIDGIAFFNIHVDQQIVKFDFEAVGDSPNNGKSGNGFFTFNLAQHGLADTGQFGYFAQAEIHTASDSF